MEGKEMSRAMVTGKRGVVKRMRISRIMPTISEQLAIWQWTLDYFEMRTLGGDVETAYDYADSLLESMQFGRLWSGRHEDVQPAWLREEHIGYDAIPD
jgi:hypothetical protein